MTIKVLMVDVDGVILRRPTGKRWDHDLRADLGIDPEALQEYFFKPYWAEIIVGRAELKTHLSKALARIAPDAAMDRLIEYWFVKDATFDDVLLADLAALRADGVPLHLATDQEHQRAAYLWNELDLRNRFDAMHYAAALGVQKVQAAFFAAVTERVGLAVDEIGFIDDSAANIAAARAAGWRGHVWTPDSQLKDALAAMGHR
jgi:putative hydrolase of the HAD superfamily